MSIPFNKVLCTKCNFHSSTMSMPTDYKYVFPDGKIAIASNLSKKKWCCKCKDIRDVESVLDADVIARLDKELAGLNSIIPLVFGLFSRLKGQRNKTKDEIINIKNLLSISKLRRSKPRCLLCSSEETKSLDFKKEGFCVDFYHDCGGRLMLDPGMNRISFTSRLTVVLDIEGNRMC